MIWRGTDTGNYLLTTTVTKPTNTSTNQTSASTSVKTGDQSPIAIYIALICAAVVCIAGYFVYKAKHNTRK